MPAKNHLFQEQKEPLVKNLKEHDNPYVREKILILLLINDGKIYPGLTIAERVIIVTLFLFVVGRERPYFWREDSPTTNMSRSASCGYP